MNKTYWTKEEIKVKRADRKIIHFHYIGPIRLERDVNDENFPHSIIFAIHNVNYSVGKEDFTLSKNYYPLSEKEYRQIIDKFVTEI